MHKDLPCLSESEHVSVAVHSIISLVLHFSASLMLLEVKLWHGRPKKARPSRAAGVVCSQLLSLHPHWMHILHICPEKNTFPLKYIKHTEPIIFSLSFPVV